MTAFDVDRHADRLARTQHGVFSRRQIVAVGASRHMIAGRIGNGRWLELAPAVYALPSHPGTWHRALMAAVLAEQRAMVAGRSAPALHALPGYRVLGIPVLTVCDSLFMVAGLSDAHRVQVALDDALVPAESVLEGMLYAILDRPEMPRYLRQAPLPWASDRRADAALVDAPVLLEADGRTWHSRVADFENDRVRDRQAAAHGFATLRFTHTDLTRPAAVTAAEILAVFRSYAPTSHRLAG